MISVIIPTLNEGANLDRLLSVLRGETADHEVIIVDGGSEDETLAIASLSGDRVINSGRGRGQQLYAGAAQAAGDVLLFLHADTVFPAGGLTAVEKALGASDVIGGNFRLLFDGDTAFSRWLIGFYAWIRRHGFYYGDSGIFARRDVYERVGGIRPIALMEDYDFVRRMEKFGRTTCIDEPPLVTSSRKFEGRRAIPIIWGWLKLHALYHLGVSPDRLARMYYGPKQHV